MLKNIINRGGCMVGMHQGEWQFVAEGSCEQVRVCTVCQTEQRRTEHAWEAWQTSDLHPCGEIRVCGRCGQTETVMEHLWKQWVYPNPAACEQVQLCERCGELGTETRFVHQWGGWAYDEAAHSPVHECERCGTKEARFTMAPEAAPASTETNWAEVGQGLLNWWNSRTIPSTAPAGDVQPIPNPQAPLPSPTQPSETAVAPDDPDFEVLFGGLIQSYEADLASGKITPAEKERFDSMLAELGAVIQKDDGDDLNAMLANVGKVRELMGRLADSSDQPSPHTQTTRRGKVSEYFLELDRIMKKEATKPLAGQGEHEAMFELMQRVMRSKATLLTEITTDEDAIALERATLRQIAYEMRQHLLRQHIGVAFPIWASTPLPVNPNRVFFSGSDPMRERVRGVCADLHLDLFEPVAQKDPAQAQWDQIRACHVAVFDMTGYDRAKETDLTLTSVVGAVAYAMGIAFTLGKPMLIVAEAGQALPFDIDVQPVTPDALANALDDAVYGIQRGVEESSLAATVGYVREQWGNSLDSNVRIMLQQLTDDHARDVIQVRRVFSQVFAQLSNITPQLIYPTFPMQYPSEKRLFHVTGFRDWAKRPTEVIEAECQKAGVVYRRGDRPMDADIVRSIWDEICLASHIVVDLTTLNANAIIEMGMAHTLGKPTLHITQDADLSPYFRAISKLRMVQYGQNEPALVNAVQGFLAQ